MSCQYSPRRGGGGSGRGGMWLATGSGVAGFAMVVGVVLGRGRAGPLDIVASDA